MSKEALRGRAERPRDRRFEGRSHGEGRMLDMCAVRPRADGQERRRREPQARGGERGVRTVVLLWLEASLELVDPVE